MITSSLLLLFLIIIISHQCFCRLTILSTEKRLNLTVEQGKSVYLTQAHIPIHPNLKLGNICQIEVDDTQPLSSAMGFIKPKKFPCFFEPNSVLYQHEGSSLTSNDNILLNIYYFRKQFSSTKNLTIFVKIIPTKKTSRILVKSVLNVPSWKGISQALSSQLISIQYNPAKEFCRIKHLNQASVSSKIYPWLAFRFWPMTGVLITFNKSKMYEFNFECQQALVMGLRFMHRKSRSSPLDFLPLIIEISSITTDEIIDVTYLHIPIHISSKSSNSINENMLPPPIIKAFRPITLKNSGGTLSILPNDCLELSNQDKERGPLIIVILSINGSYSAGFRNLRDPTKDIWSFTFTDLTRGLIAFQLQSYNDAISKEFQVHLKLMDSYFIQSEPITINIVSILENKDQLFQVFTIPFYTYTSSNRPLRSNNIQIVGHIDLNLVKYRFVNQKLNTGSFYKINNYKKTVLLGNPSNENPYFQINDTKTDSIYYTHNGGLKETDIITVEVSIDRFQFIKIQLPIYIVRLYKKSKEYLLESYMEFTTVKEGILNINIKQSINKNFYFHVILRDHIDINFDLVTIPQYGNILKLLPGQNITKSSLRLSFLKFQDFLDGLIFYQNDQKSQTIRDSLELKQQERSGEETIKIIFHIQQYGSNFLSAKMDSKIKFTVVETNQYKKLSYLNLNFASYFVKSQDIVYEIVRFPRYEDINETIDAGRLISLKSIQNDILVGDTAFTTKITNYRSAHITSVSQFTQKQVLENDIVYVPPIDDVGPDDRKVRFYYSVKEIDGYEIRNIPFYIYIKSVNNQPPYLKSFNITVPRDEEIYFTMKNLNIQDEDTKIENIFIEFVNLPIYGVLYDFESAIQQTGYKIRANRLKSETIKYKHNGHNINKDSFGIQCFDGVHTSQIYNVIINITKRIIPTSTWNLYINNSVLVKENSTVILHKSIFQNVLKHFNFKIFPNPMFILVALPTKGNVINGKIVVSTFNLDEVKKGKIGYQHSSTEIGSKSQLDFTQIWVLETGESFNLNFTILPVNSQPPFLYSQISLQVNEGGFVIINYYVISFIDLDSDENDISIKIVKPPRRGKISIKGEITPIQSFSIKDLKLGKVIYNNSLSSNGSEYTNDVFTVTGNDGKYSSTPLEVQVFIHSVNDEPPILMLNDFNIAVGQTRLLEGNIFQLSDADIPRDNLQIKVTVFPEFGNLSLKNKYGELRAITKTSAPLTMQLLNLASFVYIQDSSKIELNSLKFPVKDYLQMSVTDGKFVVVKSAVINITGYNRVPPVILSSLIQLNKISEKIISSTDLSVSDPDTLPIDIIFTLTKLPEKGDLFVRGNKLLRLQTFTQDDINKGHLTYKYLGPSVTYTKDYFLIKLFDGKFEINGKQVFVFLTQPIQIPKMSIKIMPTKIHIGQKYVLDKSIFEIHNKVVDIVKSLVITIKGKLTCGAFYYYQNLDFPIFKFTFEDVKERRIVLYISECVEVVKFLNIQLSIFSHKNFEQELIFSIEIIPRVSSVPTLKKNTTIFALIGSNFLLTKDILNAVDEDSPSDKLVYQYLDWKLNYIELYVNKLPATNFSQFDINSENVEFHIADKINISEINITFVLSDGENQGYVYNTNYQTTGLINLRITFSKWQHENLILMKYTVPNQMRVIDGYSGFQWTYNELLVSRADAQITVARDLLAGFFYNIETKKTVTSFSQININRGNIFYLLHKEKSAKIYKELIQLKIFYLTFRISSEILEMSWSIIEFDKIKFKLCPQRGLLSINVIRIGNINISSQVTVGFVSLEAVINQDFRLMSQRLLIFATGETSKTISIKILMTGSVVKENKFQITLQFPKQAVLGQKSVTTVSIKNRKTCGNKEYFLAEKSRKSPSAKELKNLKNMLHDLGYVFHDHLNSESQDLPSSEELEIHYKQYLKKKESKIKCSKNWQLFSKRCYRPFQSKLSWSNANEHCLKINSFLASIDSDSLSKWMIKLFPKSRPFWIGLYRTASEFKEWKYKNNEAVLYTNWDVGFPKSDENNSKDCVLVTKKGHWKNRPCQKKRRSFVCMKNPEVVS